MSDDDRSELKQEAHNQGQKDASEGLSFIGRAMSEEFYHHLAPGAGEDLAEAYDAGFRNGQGLPPKDE